MIKEKFIAWRNARYKVPAVINLYFGVPGSGKTSIAAYIAKKDMKHGKTVWSNVPIKGTYKVEKSDIGVYDISYGRLIWDEAGLDYNNRNWKENLTQEQLYFYKLHRHYGCAADFFSQGPSDCDIKIRQLARNMYLINRTFIPGIFTRRTIRKFVGINDTTKDLIDAYEFKRFSLRFFVCWSAWKLFDTTEHKPLPQKEWTKWGE